jgi:hypothetical protein
MQISLQNRFPGWEQGCQMVYIFSYQKYQFGYFLHGFGMENVGIFYFYLVYMYYDHFIRLMYIYGHLVNLMYICVHLANLMYICGHLVHFFRFGMFVPRKIWQPWLGDKNQNFFPRRRVPNLNLSSQESFRKAR